MKLVADYRWDVQAPRGEVTAVMRSQIIGRAVAKATNAALTLLRNRVDLNLSREEFRFSRIWFSQFGEDQAVLRWLDDHFPNAPQIYVDAGAFHPIHASNTLLLPPSKRHSHYYAK